MVLDNFYFQTGLTCTDWFDFLMKYFWEHSTTTLTATTLYPNVELGFVVFKVSILTSAMVMADRQKEERQMENRKNPT